MELKLRILMCTQVHTSSNRTFMELKYDREYQVTPQSSGSNRTFMELKLMRQHGNPLFTPRLCKKK